MKNKTRISPVFKEFVDKHPKYFMWLLILLILEGFIAAGTVLTVIPFVDFLTDESLKDPSRVTLVVLDVFAHVGLQPSFWSFGLFFVVFNLLNGGFKVAINYAVLKTKYAVLYDIIEQTLGVFFQSRWEFFSGSDKGKLLNTLNKELNVIGDTLGHIAMQFSQAIQFVIYVSVPFWINAQMTTIAILIAVLFSLPFLKLNQLSYRLGKANTETANVAIGILNETLQAARIILGFGRQECSKSRYLSAFAQHINATIKSQTLTTAVPSFFTPLGILGIVVALGVSFNGNVPISELVAVMWGLLSALPILSGLLKINVSINNFIPSYDQLVSLRRQAEKFRENKGDVHFKSLEQDISLRSVCFSYPDRGKIINDISLVVDKGRVTALVGPSGSGKSTITDLILGLQTPDSGEVLVDGFPLDFYDQNSFRKKLGYVPQEPILFHSSVKENLLWAKSGATNEELWHALTLANAADFVKELPLGIDTIVGERGVRMSGGQRQRIALARALVRSPELLVLDEATSALDSESESLIQQSIDSLSGQMTILVIAHRLSTIKNADKIYVIESGRVSEEGIFSELSKNPGSYLHM